MKEHNMTRILLHYHIMCCTLFKKKKKKGSLFMPIIKAIISFTIP